MRALRAGDSFGRYRIDRQLGAGGMGVVYAATDIVLDRPVALKLVTGRLADDPEFLARFHREAEVLARLSSPHVIQIFDHGEQDARPYIATQLVGGGDLAELIALYGALPPAIAVDVATQLADGLTAAHAVGVVHRDLKPANVLVHSRAEARPHVYLCDFGIAQTESRGLTSTGIVVVGTRAYLAPESHQGQPATAQTDIYALGCVLWEMLTGRVPYAGSDVRVGLAHVEAPVPRLPGSDPLTRQLNRILTRALAKHPAHRYPDVASMRADLAAVTQVLTQQGRTGGRRRWPAVVGAAATVLAVLSLVSAAVFWWPDRTPAAVKTSACDSPADSPQTPRPVDGDIDADGHADVAVRAALPYKEGTAAEVAVLPSDGKTLGTAKRVPVEGTEVMLGDIDGNGADDLVYVNFSSETEVRIRHHDGSFDILTVPSSSDDVSWGEHLLADVTGDGRDDLIRSVSGQGDLSTYVLQVAVSTGRELQPFRRWYAVDATPSSLGGDFDGDGKDDLAIRDAAGRTHLLRSTGTTFTKTPTEHQLPAIEDDADAYVAGDYDGDGEDELALVDAGAASQVTVFCATADGFAEGERRQVDHTGSLAEVPDGLAWGTGDLDGDGRADIVGLGPVDDGTRAVLVWRATDDGFRLDDSWGAYECENTPHCESAGLVRRETDWRG